MNQETVIKRSFGGRHRYIEHRVAGRFPLGVQTSCGSYVSLGERPTEEQLGHRLHRCLRCFPAGNQTRPLADVLEEIRTTYTDPELQVQGYAIAVVTPEGNTVAMQWGDLRTARRPRGAGRPDGA